MSARRVSRIGVVSEVVAGCATVDVGVPCGGCSQLGCGSRARSGRIQLAAPGILPGERIRLSLVASSLTGASAALFGPPLAWFAIAGLLLANNPQGWLAGSPLGPVLFGCGMVASLALGQWLGRRAGQRLAIEPERIAPAEPDRTAASEPQSLPERATIFFR
ncbi:MAG: hypothetical protein EP301_04050 [Gammaproteobacteria bacterium]|jgi:hypothetical protein|nr:MAG: hypothetical protein EP301_04050 [Gammaproteobacteria bacterium]